MVVVGVIGFSLACSGTGDAPAEDGICPSSSDLEAALADSEVGGTVSWTELTDVRCTLTWATARCVPEGDLDAATVLFMRTAKGTWLAEAAGTGGVCHDVSEEDRPSLDCEE